MFKIVPIQKTDTNCEKVSAVVSRNDESETVVVLTAWHFDEDTKGTEYLQEEIILMPSFKMACGYVDDFSELTATAFADEFNF